MNKIYALFDTEGRATGFWSEEGFPPLVIPPMLQAKEPDEGDESGKVEFIEVEPAKTLRNPLIPEGVVEVDEETRTRFVEFPDGWRWVDGSAVPYTLPALPITGDDVNRERNRRIIACTSINGIVVTGRDEDARNLTNLAFSAQLRLATGDTITTTTFRDGNNVDHDLTPPQIITLWQASAAHVSALYQASWSIKAMDPIPADFRDNQYWAAPEA